MENYRVSCKKNTANKNSTVRKTKQNRLILLSNCAFVARNYCYNYLKNFIDWRQTVRITELHLRQQYLVIVLVEYLLNIVKKLKNLEERVIIYKFLDKKTGPRAIVNKELARKLHKTVSK